MDKPLYKSRKGQLTVLGVATSLISHYIGVPEELVYTIASMFGVGVAGFAAEDFGKARRAITENWAPALNLEDRRKSRRVPISPVEEDPIEIEPDFMTTADGEQLLSAVTQTVESTSRLATRLERMDDRLSAVIEAMLVSEEPSKEPTAPPEDMSLPSTPVAATAVVARSMPLKERLGRLRSSTTFFSLLTIFLAFSGSSCGPLGVKDIPIAARASATGAVELGFDLNNAVVIADGTGQFWVFDDNSMTLLWSIGWAGDVALVYRREPELKLQLPLNEPFPAETRPVLEAVFTPDELATLGVAFSD